MEKNSPLKQIQIINILNQEYQIPEPIIKNVYLPFFLNDTDAEKILNKINEIKNEIKNTEEAKIVITDLFAQLISIRFFNSL